MKDCIIIGKGPAGLSAALYVRRAGYTPLVIGRDSGALGQSHRIENYFGLAEPVSGDELFRRGLVQVERLGIEVISDEVVSIRESNGFIVNTSSGNSYTARTVLLATGKQRLASNLNADHLIGYGVSHCAQCDGFLMRGRSLAVAGSGDHAVAELEHLRPLTEHLRLFTNGATITTKNIPSDIPIITEPITELRTDDFGMLSGVQTDKQLYPIDGLFLAQGVASAADFAGRMGVIMDGSDVKVDRSYQTNVPGLFAAGDCVGGVLQIAKAVADGAIAGLNISEFLRNAPKQEETQAE